MEDPFVDETTQQIKRQNFVEDGLVHMEESYLSGSKSNKIGAHQK